MIKLIISLSIFVLFGKAIAGECPSGQYFVNTYKRNAYYRTDGTFVKDTTVAAHCHTNNFYGHLKLVFKDKMPEG